MGAIIAWAILGLIAATLAKLFYPRHLEHKNFSTIGLGVFGALAGGYLGKFLLESGKVIFSASAALFSAESILLSVLCGMVFIFIWMFISRITEAS